MGRTRSDRVFRVLVRSLAEKDDRRRGAVEGLVAFGGNSAVEALKTWVNDRDMGFREFVVRKLGESLRQPVDAQWLIPVIRSRSRPRSLGDAPRLLRLYAGPKAVPALLSCLDFDDPAVRRYYSRAIIRSQGSCEGGLNIPWITDLNRDGTPEGVRQNRRTLKILRAWVDHYYK
jgi:hypothetical protein